MNKLKTLFFSIIIGLVVAGIVFAWTNPTANPPSDGGALYYYNSNIGIGTVSPGAKLDVAGQIKGDIAQYNCYWSANDFPCDNGYYAAGSKSYNPADNNCVVQNYCCKLK